MVDDYDYLFDDVDIELMHGAARRRAKGDLIDASYMMDWFSLEDTIRLRDFLTELIEEAQEDV